MASHTPFSVAFGTRFWETGNEIEVHEGMSTQSVIGNGDGGSI